jgi:hypothetical protein
MTGAVGARTSRPELVAEHGYDVKFALHALRQELQGTELLTTGRVMLPVPEPERSYLRSVRRGEVPLAEVLVAGRRRRAATGRPAGQPRRPDGAGHRVSRQLAVLLAPGVLGGAAPRRVSPSTLRATSSENGLRGGGPSRMNVGIISSRRGVTSESSSHPCRTCCTRLDVR